MALQKKRNLIFIVVSLITIVAGGGAWFCFVQPAHSKAAPEAVKPFFVRLETFTTNLAANGGQNHLIQTDITLKLTDHSLTDAITNRMPEVRDAVLTMLSSHSAADVLTVGGKQKLAADVAHGIVRLIAPAASASPTATGETAAGSKSPNDGSHPASSLEVLFTSFIVQ
jgi:flagellar FliL protein